MKVPFRTILCPTDLSETGNLGVPIALHLAADGATVHLLHVVESPFLGNPLYNQFVQGYIPTPEERLAGEERVRRELEALVPEGDVSKGMRIKTHLTDAVNVADAIEEEARRLGADVIVMGTHGRTGLGRLVMGSVATDVVNREGLPVVLVHEGEASGD